MTDAQSAQTALDKLIEAVEAGTWPEDWREVTRALTLHPDERHILARRAYDGSLDAALALHEALLPGFSFDIASEANGLGYVANVSDPAWCHTILADATTPARAWLLAILRAYRSVQA